MDTTEEHISLVSLTNIIVDVEPVFFAFNLIDRDRHVDCNFYERVCQINFAFGKEPAIQEIINHCSQTGVSTHDILRTLHKCGYYSIAEKYFSVVCKLRGQRCVQRFNKQDICDTRFATRYYKWLLHEVHRGAIVKPKATLRQLALQSRQQLQEAEPASTSHQRIADIYNAILAAELDTHMIFEDGLSREALCQEYESIVFSTSNQVLAEVDCYGRKGIISAVSGNFQQANDMLQRALVSASNLGPCLQLTNLLYFMVFAILIEVESNPSSFSHLRDRLIEVAQTGLGVLQYQESSIAMYWKRAFLSRIVYYLLGIGNGGNVVRSLEIPLENIQYARQIIFELDRLRDKSQPRLELLYFISRARMCELDNQKEMTVYYLREATRLAHSAKFKELQAIGDYLTYISAENSPGFDTRVDPELPSDGRSWNLSRCGLRYSRQPRRPGSDNITDHRQHESACADVNEKDNLRLPTPMPSKESNDAVLSEEEAVDLSFGSFNSDELFGDGVPGQAQGSEHRSRGSKINEEKKLWESHLNLTSLLGSREEPEGSSV